MKKALRITARALLCLVTLVLILGGTLFATLFMIAGDTSPAAKQMFVTTLLETGQLKFLANLVASEEEIRAMVNTNSMETFEGEIDTSLIVIDPTHSSGQSSSSGSGGISSGSSSTDTPTEEAIEIHKISGRTFSGTMMIVKDPSTVSLATIYPWRDTGDTLDKLVKSSGAVAGINAGIYRSSGNSGGRPYGVVVSGGEILYNSPTDTRGLVLIGLTEDHILVMVDIDGMSAKEVEKVVKEKKIRDATCFQEESSDKNNHFVWLVVNGEARGLSGMGSGLNPRTAIGQRADGALLLLVTDGRGASGHLGASASDLIDIMLSFGAVNAANLDGGSSSCMYYNNEYLMTSVTFYYSNSSWRLPFAFVVK